MKKAPALALLLSFGLLISSCAPTQASGPPEINYGRDICIQCGMIVDDPRFAAVYRLPDGTEKKFDDLGGLLIQGRDSGELDTVTVWVSDFEEEVLMTADTAFFVPTLGVASPMGHGILAFSNRDRALVVAAELGGEALDWAAVKELPVVDGMVGHHHHEGG